MCVCVEGGGGGVSYILRVLRRLNTLCNSACEFMIHVQSRYCSVVYHRQ